MKQQYRLSFDDNILVFQNLAKQCGNSLFDNPYLAMMRNFHEEFDTKIHLNVYNQTSGFCLAEMPICYQDEWKQNADWLQLSFHALQDAPPNPYKTAGYAVVAHDCALVQSEILRFAGTQTLSTSTTLHYCTATKEGCDALYDCGVRNVIGLFYDMPSYHLPPQTGETLRHTPYVYDAQTKLRFFANDIILNKCTCDEIIPILAQKQSKQFIELMIHEQYFHADDARYQPDFVQKVRVALQYLTCHNFKPAFLEDVE